MVRAPDPRRRRAGSTPRLLLTHGTLILVPVILLGVALSLGIRGTSERRGLDEGRAAALLVAQTAVSPQLDGRPLSEGLSRRERKAMKRLVDQAVADGHLLRLRLRDEHGRVVFADDATRQTDAARNQGAEPVEDDEVEDALEGGTVAHMTHVNADTDDAGVQGPAAVEVYLPLRSEQYAAPVGVLEVYLPYAPIADHVTASLDVLYRDLALGLAGLFLVLLAITVSVSRGLRREVAANAWLARHDALTGLPNRALFVERIAHAAVRAGGSGRQAVVAIMDLDHFKDLNDTLGHVSGDDLLVALAGRLDDALRPGDTVARLGGDEFGLVLRDVEAPRAELARLSALVSAEVEVSGLPLSVAPSIGYVTVSDAEVSAGKLVQQAEVAMYAAKGDHSGITAYATQLERFVAADMELIAELPQAVAKGQLLLHYQPQYDAASGAVVAAEALVRWQHPVHGLLPPGRFLPMAEHTDLIERLTEWVLATALADAARLAAQGVAIPISVNVSARSVVREDFAQQVMDALDSASVPPGLLVIEVTETALLTNPALARGVLAQLDTAGVQVSIDDFGQGQTSLGYLADLPIRELKVDRGFVTGMADDRARAAIVESVIDLGHNLGMRVVAEGIETPSDLVAVRDLGCDLAQGYHLGRPMEFGALVERIEGHGTLVPSGAGH